MRSVSPEQHRSISPSFLLENLARYLHRHLSVKSTYLNCCLTQPVTLPLAISPPLPRFTSARSPSEAGDTGCVKKGHQNQTRNLWFTNPKARSMAAYSSVKNRVIWKVCMGGLLTEPCCSVSAAHALGTGIPYCLPGHWVAAEGGLPQAPWQASDSQLDP